MKLILFLFICFLLVLSSCYMSSDQRQSVLNFDLNDEWAENFDDETPLGQDVLITEKDIIVRNKGYGDDYDINDTNATTEQISQTKNIYKWLLFPDYQWYSTKPSQEHSEESRKEV